MAALLSMLLIVAPIVSAKIEFGRLMGCPGADPNKCDCSWTGGGANCGVDDGSECFCRCCCAATGKCGWNPGPAPIPGPTPSPGKSDEYCPSAGDFMVAYGSPQLMNRGWRVAGNGGVATKAAYNLLGGYVEFDIDFSGVRTGVNANIYTISPDIGSEYNGGNYCDGADNDKPWCVEVDWIESNGNCGGATTLHTRPGPGNNGCTSWGCRANYHYNGKSSFHMRIEYGNDGTWTTIRDGQRIGPNNLQPQPSGQDWGVLAGQYRSKGAVIYSSEWTGWVPVEDCGTSGDLNASHFQVSNLKIKGSVVKGPHPPKCASVVAEE